MKFTPGPWNYDKRRVYGSDGILVSDCFVHQRINQIEAADANARLIAAAPEMLSALRGMVRMIETQRADFLEAEIRYGHEYDAARAAIASATGA